MDKTKIEWCDSTWNPITGCLHGCEYCYARGIARRFAGFECRFGGEEIPDDKKRYGRDSIWNTTEGEPLHIFHGQPYRRRKTDGKKVKANYPYEFEPTFHHYRLDEPARKKKPRTIFVGNMTDLFGRWIPDRWIAEVFEACKAAPQHRYMFLAKNPKRYEELARSGLLPDGGNYWWGTTTPTPDAPFFFSDRHNTFVSMEPILDNFENIHGGVLFQPNWIIIGAMTGPSASKNKPERTWIKNIVAAAKVYEVPVFMKNSLARIWGKPLIQKYPWEHQKKKTKNKLFPKEAMWHDNGKDNLS